MHAMELKNIKNLFSFGVELNFKTFSMLIFLLAIPNVLGAINLPTVWGFKIHLFQLGIFIAALAYGPSGGLLSGITGSLYSAFMMGNPYIIAGNAILGFFTGLFVKYRMHTVIAVMLAYAVQLPWLILTDYYLVHLSAGFIKALVIALALSNLVWGTVAHYSKNAIEKALKC